MGRPKKWPTYASWEIEETIFKLRKVADDARRVQVAIAAEDKDAAHIALSDVRAVSHECIESLERTLTGNYKRETQPNSWHTPQESKGTTKQQVQIAKRQAF